MQHPSVCNLSQFISVRVVNHCFHSALRSLSLVKAQSSTCSPRTLDSGLQKSLNWPHSNLYSYQISQGVRDHCWSCSHCFCPSEFFMPGLVDTHIHAAQYSYAGTGLDMPLLQWLETYTFPVESCFNDLDFARSVYTQVVVSFLELRHWPLLIKRCVKHNCYSRIAPK